MVLPSRPNLNKLLENTMRLVIIDEENDKMQVGIDGSFYSGLDGSSLAADIHAVQWYDTYGDIEYQDPTTRRQTSNADITSATQFQFAIDLWVVAKRQELYDDAYGIAHTAALNNGDSESDADAAGVTAGNAAKNAYVAPTL